MKYGGGCVEIREWSCSVSQPYQMNFTNDYSKVRYVCPASSSMATQHPSSASTSHEPDLLQFQQLEDYAWDSDTEFQSGLQAILGPDPSAEQAEHLTLRARCFYFARYGYLLAMAHILES